MTDHELDFRLSCPDLSSVCAAAMGEKAGSQHPLYVQTPLLRSKKLSERVGANVWLKMETVQTSGSFKTRGLSNFAKKVSEPAYYA